MQKALLGLAIVIILALVTALVGPLFVEWGDYRAQFEAVATQLVGLEVKVVGPIDLRILPAPVVTLREITVGRPDEINPTHARALRIEFALPALIGGELRAAEVTLERPDLALNLDSAGRLDWTAPSISFDPNTVSIDHLAIKDGRATLTNGATGKRLVLDRLDFTGQVGSLRGPVKGDGSFTLDGRSYPYALTTSRAGDDGAVKLRLNLDPGAKSRTAQLDASLMLDHGVPKFDGSVQWVHAADAAGPDATQQPWRLSAHVHGDSASAQLDQVELQYGPDDRAVHLHGTGSLDLGAKPQLNADLATPEMDLDRVLALPEAGAHRPLAAARDALAALAETPAPPLAVRLGIGVDSVTLAGAPLQNMHVELSADAGGWSIAKLALRAPGVTQFGLSGRLRPASGAIEFAGKTEVTSVDPPVLIGWLAGRGGVQLAASGSLRLAAGSVKIDGNRIALDELEIEHERTRLQGYLDYVWPAAGRPASIDADLHGPRFDLDRMLGLLNAGWSAGASDLPFVRPGAGSVTIDVEQAAAGGIEARNLKLKMRGDAGAVTVEQLAVEDIGGAKLALDGHVDHLGDAGGAAPQGHLTLNLDAHSLDGIAALVEKVSAADAERLRGVAAQALPVKLRTSLEIGPTTPNSAAPSATTTRFELGGNAGQFHVDVRANVRADGGAAVETLLAGLVGNVGWLPTRSARLGGNLDLTARLDAADGNRILELAGLDRIFAIDKRGGLISLEAHGPLDREVAVEGKVALGGLELGAKGAVRLADANAQGKIALALAATDVQALRPVLSPAPGQRISPPKADLKASLVLSGGEIRLDQIAGKVADTGIKGHLAVALAQSPRLDGDLTLDTVDVPRAIAAAIGFPNKASGDAAWPAEPFDQGLIGEGWAGRFEGGVRLHAARAALTPKLFIGDLAASLNVIPAGIEAADIDGSLAGGRISGNLALQRGPDGLTARSHLALAAANAGDLLPDDGKAVTGRVTADIDLTGAGRSPVALIGSLTGSGTLALQGGAFARLAPAAYETIVSSVDRGFATDAVRIGEQMEVALSKRALPIAQARATIAVSAGQLSLTDASVEATGADLTVTGGVDLTERSLTAGLMLSSPVAGDGEASRPPPVLVKLTGPIVAPRRELDVDRLSQWLTLRAADQKGKRLDALQAAREAPSDPAGSTGPAPAEPGATPRPTRPAPTGPTAPSRQRATDGQQPSASIGATTGASGERGGDELRPRRPSAAPPAPLDIRPTTVR